MGIHAPRRNPRQRSLHWRTLYWLLRREAMLRILIHPPRPGDLDVRYARDWILKQRGNNLIRNVTRRLRRHPSARYCDHSSF